MKRNPIIAASEHTEPDAAKARGLERRFPNRLWADDGSAKPITYRRSGTLRLAMIWLFALALAGNVRAQVNSGSDGELRRNEREFDERPPSTRPASDPHPACGHPLPSNGRGKGEGESFAVFWRCGRAGLSCGFLGE